jgi:hypothetical protein
MADIDVVNRAKVRRVARQVNLRLPSVVDLDVVVAGLRQHLEQ